MFVPAFRNFNTYARFLNPHVSTTTLCLSYCTLLYYQPHDKYTNLKAKRSLSELVRKVHRNFTRNKYYRSESLKFRKLDTKKDANEGIHGGGFWVCNVG